MIDIWYSISYIAYMMYNIYQIYLTITVIVTYLSTSFGGSKRTLSIGHAAHSALFSCAYGATSR